MTNLKIELSTKLEKILHIYVLAQDSYLYTEYFHNPDTEEEKKLVFNSPHSSNIKFIMHLMFRNLITEVSKLYTAREKFSIIAFVSSLSPSGHFRKFDISPQYILHWNESFKQNQDIISNVLLLRDKVYAHTDDPLKKYFDTELTFKNIKALLDLAAEILKEIYRVVLDTDLLLRSPTFDRERFVMLKLLAKAERQRVEDIYKKYFPNRR
jgi:hypothetical protein